MFEESLYVRNKLLAVVGHMDHDTRETDIVRRRVQTLELLILRSAVVRITLSLFWASVPWRALS